MFKTLVPLRTSDAGVLLPPYASRVPPTNPMVVSIAPIEAAALAGRYPIAWRREEGGWDLVCVCGLDPSQRISAASADGDPVDEADQGSSLPILIAAWPLTVIDDGTSTGLNLMRDTSSDWTTYRPYEPLRTGEAPAGPHDPGPDDVEAFGVDGRPSVAFERRTSALWSFVQSRRKAAPYFAEMGEAGAFVTWDLDLRRVGISTDIRGLYYISSDFLAGKIWPIIVERAGLTLASLATVHQISLFEIQAMISAWRTA